MRKTSDLLGKNIPLVQAAHYGGRQRPTAVLIRTSWTTDDAGAANGIAQAWHSPNNREDSCHYVVDESQTIRCVSDKVQAYSTKRFHKGTISVNVCHNPPFPPTVATLVRASRLTARLCKLYRIRARILSDLEKDRWILHSWKSRGGIILETAGDFPADTFLAYVHKQIGR